jgi:proteasome regulatory subunit
MSPAQTNSAAGYHTSERIKGLEAEKQQLQNEIKQLKISIEELKAKLLEANIAAANAREEIIRLQQENIQLRRPPLFIGSVIEIYEDNTVLVKQHGSNQEYLVKVVPELYNKLELNTRVALNSSLAIVKIIGKTVDPRAQVMEVIEAPNVDYSSIGGLSEQIQELVEAVEMPLTDPELFKTVGIEPPKGVLLYGPPGTGKTLLAKAVANRAKATFIKMSGSELVHKFIGEGAQLVRDLFQLARKKAPSIVFIDEIDAVGSRRTYDGTSGSAEVNRTMTQLLAELDGFSERGNVRIIAATNRIDMLDPALLRPGRFDRMIEIPLPDFKGREEIFKIHTRNMSLSRNVKLSKLAELTEGMTGADIRAIAMEAGMFAIRRRGKTVTEEDFIKAIEKVQKKAKEKVEIPPGMFG